MNLAEDQNRIGLTAESNLGGRICEQGLYHLPHQVATIGSIKLKISIKIVFAKCARLVCNQST